jgi:hypothetical protein
MRKRSSINSPGDMGKFTKSLARIVTGNPIAEDYSPIAKDKASAKNRSMQQRARAKPARSKLQKGEHKQER